MKKASWVTAVNFQCLDCGRIFQEYKNGQALAAKHAKIYKHEVKGEVVIACSYDGKSGGK